MDFKKAFIAITVAFLTVLIDAVLKTMYIFPIVVIAFLTYFLMKFYEEAGSPDVEVNTKNRGKEINVKSIPRCNVEFLKAIVKKRVKDYEGNRFLVGYLNKKVTELKEKKIDLQRLSLAELSGFFDLKEKLSGNVFAKKGFFESELKDFFGFLDRDGMKYYFKVNFETGVECSGLAPFIVEVVFHNLKLTERQIGIVLTSNRYTGKNRVVEKLLKVRKVVEDSGGFFVIVKGNGLSVFFGFAGYFD